MSRQHFRMIADVLNCQRERAKVFDAKRQAVELSVIDTLAHSFASELARTNPRFNRTRFLEACGVEVR